MRVKVTKEHIQQGSPCSQERCPLALAVRERLLKRHDSVLVRATLGRVLAFVEDKADPQGVDILAWGMSGEEARWMLLHDMTDGTVEPREFRLRRERIS